MELEIVKEIITITKEQFDELVAQHTELKNSVSEMNVVTSFVVDNILGGKIPETEKDMDVFFYGRIAKNLVNVGFTFSKNPKKFEGLVMSLKYLFETMPKYMTAEQLKKYNNNEG